jgi:hypothetical protein
MAHPLRRARATTRVFNSFSVIGPGPVGTTGTP